MAEHTITVTLTNGKALLIPPKQQLEIGDTVIYRADSPSHSFRVVYQVSPFAGRGSRVIRDSRPRKVSRPGKFRSRCFITGPNGREVGWSTASLEAGGEQDVRP